MAIPSRSSGRWSAMPRIDGDAVIATVTKDDTARVVSAVAVCGQYNSNYDTK